MKCAYRKQWDEDGYVLLPGFVEASTLLQCERIVEAVVAAWYREHEGDPGLGRTTNMSGLTEPRYHGHIDDLSWLLGFIADDRILAVLEACGIDKPIFHNTQFFFEQRRESWDGDWHRDTQFDARDDDDEKARMSAYTGVHFRVAFAADPWLEIVPGSHRRWDTPAELAVRKAEAPEDRSGAVIRGSRTLVLERGDALLFHAWSIHRGRYRMSPKRRSLDVIYGSPGACPFATPDPTCFRDSGVLDRLERGPRAFFERFVAAYEDRWKRLGEAP